MNNPVRTVDKKNQNLIFKNHIADRIYIFLTTFTAMKYYFILFILFLAAIGCSDKVEPPQTTKPSTFEIDSTNKFPVISDEALLTLVQKQTFKYFWDFGHPISGLARERNTSGDVVTSGGSGFGIMTIPVAIERKFISRTEGLERMQKIVGFLKDKTQKFHGAFPHWINGATGAVIPFSTKDNGADLVETSYLIQGLLTARQYFNGTEIAVQPNLVWDSCNRW